MKLQTTVIHIRSGAKRGLSIMKESQNKKGRLINPNASVSDIFVEKILFPLSDKHGEKLPLRENFGVFWLAGSLFKLSRAESVKILRHLHRNNVVDFVQGEPFIIFKKSKFKRVLHT
jgi:hypothetical protein